jgi:hypothetical protein
MEMDMGMPITLQNAGVVLEVQMASSMWPITVTVTTTTTVYIPIKARTLVPIEVMAPLTTIVIIL